MNPKRTFRRGQNNFAPGFTLIELMVVIVIIGILTAMIVPEMRGTFQDALLRSTSRKLMNVFDLAYSRAVSLNQLHRVRLDETTGQYLVEKRVWKDGRENFAPAEDAPGEKGDLDSRITVEFRHAPKNVSGDGAPNENADGADDVSMNRATVNFYPDGTADAGEILLRDREGFKLVLRINPITARVHVVETENENEARE